jgi:hypothetical protein
MSYNLETRVEKLERQQPSNPYVHLSDAELEARLAEIDEQFFQLSGIHFDKLSPIDQQLLKDAVDKGGETETTVLQQLKAKQAAEAAAGAS